MKKPMTLAVLLLAAWLPCPRVWGDVVEGEIPGTSPPDEQNSPGDITMFSSPCSCPDLPVEPIPLEQFTSTQPYFVTAYPKSYKYANLDNVCHTTFPLPDNNLTVINYISYTFSDGSNQVESYVSSQLNPGAYGKGSSNCNFVDLAFAKILPGALNCTDTILLYSCYLSGECPKQDNDVQPVYALSRTYAEVSPCCLALIEATTSLFLPPQEFMALPMALPSRCVIRQISRLYPKCTRQ